MVLSGAERARRCREKKKAVGLSEIIKTKDRLRKRTARAQLSPTELRALRLQQKINLQRFRAKEEGQVLPARPSSSFANKQSKGKAMNRIRKVLPVTEDKQIEIVRQMAEKSWHH